MYRVIVKCDVKLKQEIQVVNLNKMFPIDSEMLRRGLCDKEQKYIPIVSWRIITLQIFC